MRRPARLRAHPLRTLPEGPTGAATAFVSRRHAARAARAAGETRRTSWAVAAAFLLFVFLSVSLVHWKVASVPVRAIYGVGLMGLLMVGCPAQLALALQKQRNTLLVIAGFAVLGAVVSTVARAAPATVLRQLLEIHVQAAVNLLVAAAVLEVCGPRTLVRTFVGVVGFSMGLAVLQGAGVEPAWSLREALGPLLDADQYGRGRAAGLSLNPVLLGTQACLSIAMLYMYERYRRPPDDLRPEPSILLICAAALVVAVISGARSPVVGILVFLAFYITRRFGAWALVAGLVCLAATPLVMGLLDQFQGSDVRVLQTQDKSAIGRWPLLLYGVRLFLANPLGYGLGFDPSEHWAEHWSALSHIKNAAVIRSLELHNYFLNTLNKYGSGMLLLAPFVMALTWRHWVVLLGFAPYALHILFHNDGPLDTDYMIWFVIALSSMPLSGAGSRSNSSRLGRSEPARGPESD